MFTYQTVVTGVTGVSSARVSAAAFLLGVCCYAVQVSAQPSAARQAAPASAVEVPPITKAARERGFVRCAGALELAERNLLSTSEYAFRTYPPSPKIGAAGKESNLFTAIVDSRKRNLNDPAPRATLNLTVLVSPQTPNACTTIYEQTVYHNATCEAVLAQMAPNGKQSSGPSLGSVLIEISENLTLTLIPVGTAQCITVVKEAAFDVPLTSPATTPAAARR